MRTRILGALTLSILLAAAWPASAEINLWISYFHSGEDTLGEALYPDTQALASQALDESTVDHRRAFTYDTLGRTQTVTGDYARAEESLITALCLKEKALGERSRTVPITLNHLGDLHYIAGDIEDAEDHYRKALDIHLTDQLNVEVCRSLNGMALIHSDRSEYAEAERLLKTAIDKHQRAGRRYHPYMATALANLGILYMQQGRLDDAERYLHKAGYIQSRALRHDHPDIALRLHAQAELYLKMDKLAEARQARNRADEIDATFAQRNMTPRAAS